MSNYSQNVFFTPKDSLASGNAAKRIRGSEIDAELQEISDAIATKIESDGVPSGTKMIMVETSAPTGWTLVTGYDDKTIILADSPTDDDTPDTDGSWTIGGLTHEHTHTVSGDTGVSLSGTINGENTGANSIDVGDHVHTVNITSSGVSTSPVVSDMSWRPSYVEAIVCSKD